MPFVRLGYKTIHYTDLRPKDADARETFIFTHGIGSSQNDFYAIAVMLQSHHFRCIIFDTTGAARSPYTQIEQSIESLGEDIVGILDALEVSKAIVVGHGLGSYVSFDECQIHYLLTMLLYSVVAAHLAAERNDRVVAAVLIGPIYLPNTSLQATFKKRVHTVEKNGMDAMANTLPNTDPAKDAPPLVRAFIRELLLAQDARGYISQCRVLINAKAPRYDKIAVPVLIIAGEEDHTAPLDTCEKLFEALGTEEKKFETLKEVGHCQCLEAADEVGRLIRAFYHEIQ
jgi:pimeloyl-ACP methyl ester carboxylesterase